MSRLPQRSTYCWPLAVAAVSSQQRSSPFCRLSYGMLPDRLWIAVVCVDWCSRAVLRHQGKVSPCFLEGSHYHATVAILQELHCRLHSMRELEPSALPPRRNYLQE